MDKKGYIVPYCLVMFFMKEHILQTDEKGNLSGRVGHYTFSSHV
jgi:hypothetical protein